VRRADPGTAEHPTIMRVTVADVPKAPAFDLAGLGAAFRHHADGSGVVRVQPGPDHPSGRRRTTPAYGTSFGVVRLCNAPGRPGRRPPAGWLRQDRGGQQAHRPVRFNGLKAAFAPGTGKLQIPFQPKGLHDEMNSDGLRRVRR